MAVNIPPTKGAMAMSRDNGFWQRFGLTLGADIQDNQLALPHEWDEPVPSSPTRKTASIRKFTWLQRTAPTPAYDSHFQMKSLAA